MSVQSVDCRALAYIQALGILEGCCFVELIRGSQKVTGGQGRCGRGVPRGEDEFLRGSWRETGLWAEKIVLISHMGSPI